MNTFDILQKHDISLISITEGFDPNTPVGMMMMTMIAGFAEMERMNIAQRVKDNMKALAKLGRWSGGTPPKGYIAVRKKNGEKTAMYLELVPEYKDLIFDIFKLAAENHTSFEISKLKNIPSKTITSLINNPVYCKSDKISKKYLETEGYEVYGELNGCGYLPYGRRPKKKNGKKDFNADGMLVAVSIHEAIVDSELWINANNKLKQRGLEARPRYSEKTFLAHKVKCKCGSNMYVNAGHKRKDGTKIYYFCCSSKKSQKNCDSKRINVNKLESDVLEILKKISTDEVSINNFISSRSESDISSEINKLKIKIRKYNTELDNLSSNLSRLKGAAADKIINNMNKLSEEIAKTNEKMLLLECKNIQNRAESINIQSIHNEICYMLDNWDSFSIDDKQRLINNIIQEIEMTSTGKFKVKFRI